MKKIILIILFLTFTVCLYAQMNRTNSRIKQIREFMNRKSRSNSKENSKKKSKSKNKPKYRIYRGSVFLANNAQFKGKIMLSMRKIVIRHKKDGVVFKKVLMPEKIKSLEIMKYRAKMFRRGSKYKAYYFLPIEFKIIYNDGNIYYFKNMIASLLQFKIYSNMGKAVLKTYFKDYWLKRKKIWYYSKSSDSNYPINNARGKTVVKIILNKIKKEK